LLHGHILEDGRAVETSAKYQKAIAIGTQKINED
jgi:hypothetical protein